MFAVDVVAGKAHQVTAGNSTLTAAPGGDDSVIYDPGTPGQCNDELIVYKEDAVRPIYLIRY
eukprot:GAFH01004100.1.p5 GENE.GAFH01004100.1~~GAFH01004100.1.p5  ORF type:complete len:62 (-),score=1.46 GAFH01004100.1:108-293(-)